MGESPMEGSHMGIPRDPPRGESPMGDSSVGIPPGDSPMGESPVGIPPMGDSPLGIPSWGFPHGGIPMRGMGIPHRHNSGRWIGTGLEPDSGEPDNRAQVLNRTIGQKGEQDT